MSFLHSFRRAAAGAALVLAVAGCASDGADDGGGGGGGGGGGPLPYTPAGDPVTQRIGPAGGTVATSDGGALLTIPAGALAAETDVTIRPVANTAPGGMGLAYRLEPSSLPLTAAAELTLSVPALLLANTVPEAVGVGLRNEAGDWYGDPNSSGSLEPAAAAFTLSASQDRRVVSTVRVEGLTPDQWIEYATFAFWVVKPNGPWLVPTGQSLTLSIEACLHEQENAHSTGDFLPALPRPNTAPPGSQCRPSVREGTWFVNNVRGGNGTVGFVAGGGNGTPSSQAEFVAPTRVPTPSGVQVRADMFWRKRGVTKSFQIPVTIQGGGFRGTASGSFVSPNSFVGALLTYDVTVTWVRKRLPGEQLGFETYIPFGYAKVAAANRCMTALQPDSIPLTEEMGVLKVNRRDGTWSGEAGITTTDGVFHYTDTCANSPDALVAPLPFLYSVDPTPLPVQGTFGTSPTNIGNFSYPEE